MKNTGSKWIGPNGFLSSSRAIIPQEAVHFIKKEAKRVIENKQGTKAVRNTNIESKSAYQQNPDFKSSRISIYPLHIANHYLKLSKENEKYFYDRFKKKLNDSKETSFSHEVSDKEGIHESNDTISPNGKFNRAYILSTTHDFGVKESPSNYQLQLANTTEELLKMQENSSISSNDTAKKESSHEVGREIKSINEFQSENSYTAIAEKKKQEKIPYLNSLPTPSRCPPLDPLQHSSKHINTDENCGQSLEGWTKDPQCVCVYFVAEYNNEGCPIKFHTLCYRPIDQKTDYKTEGLQISEKSFGQNIETDSSGQREKIGNYDHQSTIAYKLLNEKRESEMMERSRIEGDKKLNQTVPIDQEAESKESESKGGAESTSETFNINEFNKRSNETLESSEQI
ncbi:unnamed protein product [Cercopithifilaria johnstoni]|uniref:Uncharacterized protein n=1 Tax=Cercopithifilaria johnstoni TaxID=2874296 RepID=A0A8J2Q8S2_9BILA|nr:unnamed protein product [Cercopithifilaria johnstoni]